MERWLAEMANSDCRRWANTVRRPSQGRSADRSGAVRPEVLVVDELAERMPHEGPERPG